MFAVARIEIDWPQFLASAVLVVIRFSGMILFAPFFSSPAIAPRVKAALVIAMSILLAPVVATLPNRQVAIEVSSVLGELGVGLVFGLSLMFLNEAMLFAGTILGMQFSFSLVNLLDPNSMIETPVLGQMLTWLGILVFIGSGLDRVLLAAIVRSFVAVPIGHAVVTSKTGTSLASMCGGIFLAGLQLAGPVLAATLTVEVTIGLVTRLSPRLPAMVLGVPLKTMVAYTVLVGSLAVWPRWIERHFSALLDFAGRLMVMP
jgi:flagellar biosynthetic protein FliR